MVVSEIIDRLSPNIAPQTTAPIQRAGENPVLSLIPAATGARAAMVPILVPIDREIKQPISIRPMTATEDGRMERQKFTVLSTPPAARTAPENPPAARKIRHMVMMFSSPTPFAITFTFSSNFSEGFWRNATVRAIRNPTTAGIALKFPLTIPIPRNETRNTPMGSSALALPFFHIFFLSSGGADLRKILQARSEPLVCPGNLPGFHNSEHYTGGHLFWQGDAYKFLVYSLPFSRKSER